MFHQGEELAYEACEQPWCPGARGDAELTDGHPSGPLMSTPAPWPLRGGVRPLTPQLALYTSPTHPPQTHLPAGPLLGASGSPSVGFPSTVDIVQHLERNMSRKMGNVPASHPPRETLVAVVTFSCTPSP